MASIVIVVLVAMLVNTLFFSHVTRGGVREGRFQWGVVWKYLFVTPVLKGIVVTLELTAIAMVVGVVHRRGARRHAALPQPLLSGSAWIYIWFFRGTPVLVQLTFWYVGITYLYPTLTLGVPFGPYANCYTVNGQHADDLVHRCRPRPQPQRGRLYGRDRAGRHHLGGRRDRPRRPSPSG